MRVLPLLFAFLATTFGLLALPPTPAGPSPLAGATNVPVLPILSWDGGANPIANGGFEEGFSGWIPQAPQAGAGVLRTVTNHAATTFPRRQIPPVEGKQMALLSLFEPTSGGFQREFTVPQTGHPVRLVFADWVRAGDFQFSLVPTFEGAYAVELWEFPAAPALPIRLKSLRPPILNQAASQDWTRWTADITEFAGRTVRLVIFGRMRAGSLQALVDDCRLEVEAPHAPEYEIRLGGQPDLGAHDLLALTHDSAVASPRLRPGSTNYWQVIARDETGETPGPVWSFVAGPLGAPGTLAWSDLRDPVFAGNSTEVLVQVQDALGNELNNFQGFAHLLVQVPSTNVPKVVISQLGPNSSLPAGGSPLVEVANVSTALVNLGGWRLTVWDQARWPEPVTTVMFPGNANLLGGRVASVRSSSSWVKPGTFPNLTTTTPFYWSNRPTNQLAAALLRDNSGKVIDFVVVGGADPAQIVDPIRIPVGEWMGASLPGFPGGFQGSNWYRTINADRQTAEDWSRLGLNRPFTLPFAPTPVAFPITPSQVPLDNGSWEGQINLAGPLPPGPAELVAFTTNGLIGRRTITVATPPPILVEVPTALGEIAGTITSGGKVRIPASLTVDLKVDLVSSDPTDLAIPASVVIPAGASEVSFDLNVGDDTLRDGTESVTLRASAEGYTTVPAEVLIADSETATLGFLLPDSAVEGDLSQTCWVTVTPPPDQDLRVFVSAGFPIMEPFYTDVVVPAGRDGTPFRLSIPDDVKLNGTHSIGVTAFVQNWPLGNGTLSILDEDRAELSLTLPRNSVESDQVLTNAGRIRLGGSLQTNVLVRLTSSNPQRVQPPAEVQVPAGQLEVTFDVTLADTFDAEGEELITVTAGAFGFTSTNGSILIADNDAATFEVGPIDSPQLGAWSIRVPIRALGTNDAWVDNFRGPLTVFAQGPEGPVPVTVENLFFGGQGYATAIVSVDALGTGYTIGVTDGHGHSGTSYPFTLLEPPYRKVGGTVTDVVWHAGSARLYAAILGTAANGTGGRLVGFDPVSRTEKVEAPLVPPVDFLVTSGGGEFLYAVSSTDARILQYTLPDLQLVRTWTVQSEDGNPSPVVDLAVQPGHPEVVAVSRAQANAVPAANGIAVYDQGVKRPNVLDAFTQRVNRIEFSPSGEILYGYENETTANTFSRMQVDANGVALVRVDAFTTGSFFRMDFSLYGEAVVFGDGQVYFPTTLTNRSLAFGGADLAIAPEPSRQAVYGAEVSGTDLRVRSFDFVSGRETGATILPGLSSPFGSVNRLARWGNDGLAVVVGGTLAYWTSDLVPSPDPVDLVLSLPAGVPKLIAQRPANLELKLTNQLPTTAPGVNLFLPGVGHPLQGLSVRVAGKSVEGTSYGDQYIVSIGDIAPGTAVAVTVEFTPLLGGPLQFSSFVTAHAPEEVRDNNVVNLDFYTDVRIDRGGMGNLKLAVDSLTGSAHRPLLYVGQASEHRVAELDPATGRLGRTVTVDLPVWINRLTLSGDASRLYAASTEGNTAVEIDTASMTVVREFPVGSAAAGLRPAQIAVRPGAPETLLVLTANSAHVEDPRHLELYESGVNVAQKDGFVNSIAFSTDGQRVYGIDPGRDPVGHRWQVTAEGLQDLGSFTRWVGTSIPDIEVSDGRINLYGRFCRDDADLTPIGRTEPSMLGLRTVLAPEVGRLLTVPFSGTLSIYDLDRAMLLATTQAPSGRPGDRWDLVRWGADGLAWSEQEQVALLRTDWLAADTAEADLDVDLTTTGQPEAANGPIQVQVTVRNQGPGMAQRVLLNLNTAPDIQISRNEDVLPPPEFERALLDVPLGNLAAGAEIHFTLSFTRADSRQVLPLGLVVRSDATDRNTSNQIASAFLNWMAPGATAQWVGLGNSVNQALWDPHSRRFYLTINSFAGRAGNSLVSFDSATGQFGRPIFPGSMPNRLALADDGSRLYVSLDGTSEVAVFDLPSLTLSQRFPLGLSPNGVFLRTVSDSFVMPGHPNDYVASLAMGLNELTLPADGTALYRDGVKAPIELPGSMATRIEPAVEPGVIIGTDSQSQPPMRALRVEVTPNGLENSQLLGSFEGSPGHFVVEGSWIVGEDGSVLNNLSNVTEHLDRFVGPGAAICTEPDGSYLYAMSSIFGSSVQAYRVGDAQLQNQLETGLGSGPVTGSFQRWGVDGFAYHSSSGLWLYRSRVVQPSATADWDGDGLPDAWEQANSTNPHVNDAHADLDGDGFDNSTEWAAGTAANDSGSRFQFRLVPASEGLWEGQFQARTGRRYQLESAVSITGPWTPIGKSLEGADGPVSVPLPSTLGTQWFRVTLTMP